MCLGRALIALLCVPCAHASSYFYPIAHTLSEDAQSVLVMHQQGDGRLFLYAWDSNTQRAQKLLWSAYTPQEVQLLPGRAGFGFVCDDKICVKYFEQRSVRTFDFSEEPLVLGAIGGVCWLNDHLCYFHAKKDARYGIYAGTDDGHVWPIITDDAIDCMYPCRIGTAIFFVGAQQLGPIKQSAIYQCAAVCRGVKQARRLGPELDGVIVAFHMRSAQEGFMVIHHQATQAGSNYVEYSFYRLALQGNAWQHDRLFTFKLPVELLCGYSRLYEALGPLLPHVAEERIYFSSLVEGSLVLHEYCLRDRTCCPCAKFGGHLFAPVMTKNGLFCGGQQKEKAGKPGFGGSDGRLFLVPVTPR